MLFQHAMAPDRTELERWTASLEEQTRSAVVAWLTEAVQERLCGAGSKYSYISFTKHVQVSPGMPKHALVSEAAIHRDLLCTGAAGASAVCVKRIDG